MNRDLWVWAVALLAAVRGAAQTRTADDLRDVSLQELMDMQVVSVSKREQSLSKSGAAVSVITQEDIRRSGMTNIPDLLRLVPGVNVARIDANAWAISIRGYNFRYSSKVLVLIDGRTVYTPDFSGVYWDQQSVPLEDIDRIEVIRGPGGTVWGANAMNGVINIITKSAAQTKGGLVSAGAGSEDRAQTLAQYGGALGAKGAYRAYGRYFNVAGSRRGVAGPVADAWHGSQLGFRSDWNLSGKDVLRVQGDLFGASENETIDTLFFNRLPNMYTFDDKIRAGSGDILGRWDHTFTNGSEASVQMSYDRVRRRDLGATEIMHTGAFDAQYDFRAGSRHHVVAGVSYRITDETLPGAYAFAFDEDHERARFYGTFVQDAITLRPDLVFTIGSKFEHNNDTGYEYEPSAQLVWSPTSRQTVWASVSQAIQQPSWYFADSITAVFTFPTQGGGFALYQMQGNPKGKAAAMLDYEIGYRGTITRRVALDATAFASRYRDLQTLEPLTPYFTSTPGPPHLVLSNVWENMGRGFDYGGELSATVTVTNRWRITAGYSYLQMHTSLEPGSKDTSLDQFLGDSPKMQAQVRSTMNLPHRLEWDSFWSYVGPLRTGPVPSYVRVDTRLGRRIGESGEFSIGGQNLLTPHHPEFLDALQTHEADASRSVFAKLTWRF